jgi:hypothetical protein
MESKSVDCFSAFKIGTFCENGSEHLSFIKGVNFKTD